MSTARFAALALVAACSSKKSAPPPAAPCLPGEISSTGAGIAAVDGITAYACWGRSCLTLDRDGNATGSADYLRTEALSDAAAFGLIAQISVTSANVVTVCDQGGHGRCVEMHAPATWIGPSVTPVLAASASHKRLTAFLADSMETWDPKTATKLSTFPTTGPVTVAVYIGDNRVISRGDGIAWTLHDTVSGQAVPVGEPGWHLTVIDAKTAVVFHGAKLTVVNAAGMSAGASFTLPGRVSMATAWFDRILVVLEHPASTAQIDPATGTIYTGPALPLCQ